MGRMKLPPPRNGGGTIRLDKVEGLPPYLADGPTLFRPIVNPETKEIGVGVFMRFVKDSPVIGAIGIVEIPLGLVAVSKFDDINREFEQRLAARNGATEPAPAAEPEAEGDADPEQKGPRLVVA